MMVEVRATIQRDLIDEPSIVQQLEMRHRDVGATVRFLGRCRGEKGRLRGLFLEHYPAMAETQLSCLTEQAVLGLDILGISVVHRFGTINVGEDIVLVAVVAEHRRTAFMAAMAAMDDIKRYAPFWKKEILADSERDGSWVMPETRA